MRTKLYIENTEYLMDFAFTKAKEVWPDAVILDQGADLGFCRRPAARDTYGFDIFRSQPEVEQLFSGDCCPPPPSVNVSCTAGEVSMSGSPDVVKHLANHPLWSSA